MERIWLPLAALLVARALLHVFVIQDDVVIPVVDLLLLLMAAEALRSLRTGVVKNPQWLESDVDVRAFYGPGLQTFPKRLAELRTLRDQRAALQAQAESAE